MSGTEVPSENGRPALPAGAASANTRLAARIAGACFLLNALFTVLVRFFPSFGWPPKLWGLALLVGVDGTLGLALVRGRSSWRRAALVRVVLGAVFLAGRAGDNLPTLTLVLFTLGFIGLLAGDPPRQTIVASLAAILGVFVLRLVVAHTAPHPIDHIDGVSAPWHLDLPPGHWVLRDVAPGSHVDRHIVDVAQSAGIIVTVEHTAPDTLLPVDAYMRSMLDVAQRKTANFRVVREGRDVSSPLGPGRIADFIGAIEGVEQECYDAVFVGNGVVYRISAHAPAATFEEVRPELDQILSTLR